MSFNELKWRPIEGP